MNNLSFFDKYQNLFVKIAFFNIFIFWGSTFIAVIYGLKGFPPFILTGIRFLVAGSLLMLYSLIKGEKPLIWQNWVRNMIPAALVLTGGTGLVAWCEQYITSTEAAIAGATGPFWFVLFDKKNWNYYLSNKLIVIGLILGFFGLIVFLNDSLAAASTHSTIVSDETFRFIAFGGMALSSIFWVAGSLFSKNRPSSHSTIMNIAQQLLLAGVFNTLIATIRSEWTGFEFAQVPLESWFGLSFLIFVGSIITYISYIWLMTVRTPAKVSVHTYINPIVAVFLGIVLNSENITGLQIVGLFIILFGVLLTSFNTYTEVFNKLVFRYVKSILKLKYYRITKYIVHKFFTHSLPKYYVFNIVYRILYPSRYHA